MQAVTYAYDSPCLSELPLELWKQVLTSACEGSDQLAQNIILSAFCVRSKTLRSACASCRTSIRLCHTQIASGLAHLHTMVGLTTVTVCFEDGITLRHDLLLLSHAIPHLTSLTLTPDQKSRRSASVRICIVGDINTSLNPFRDSLSHLCIESCKVLSSPRGLRLDLHLNTGWAPDSRALKSLVLRNCELESLNLSQCEGLHTLEMTGLMSLKSVDLSGSKGLHRVVCNRNSSLAELKLKGCRALGVLECWGNSRLKHLTLPVKHGMHFIF